MAHSSLFERVFLKRFIGPCDSGDSSYPYQKNGILEQAGMLMHETVE